LSYQPGRVVRRTLLPRGSIRKISTSVLVDQTVRWEGVGPKAKKSLVPPSPEVLKGIHDVIAGMTGFNEQRGDQIIVETLPFESSVSAEPPSAVPAPPKPNASFDFRHSMVLGGGAVLLLVLLGGGFLSYRGASRKRTLTEDRRGRPALSQGESTALAEGAMEGADAGSERQMLESHAEQSQLEAGTSGRMKLPSTMNKTEVLVRQIRESVQKDPAGAANVLRTWVSDAEAFRKPS
jgi:flagellar M-ring protein FliF